jgi:hypothetical protein
MSAPLWPTVDLDAAPVAPAGRHRLRPTPAVTLDRADRFPWGLLAVEFSVAVSAFFLFVSVMRWVWS